MALWIGDKKVGGLWIGPRKVQTLWRIVGGKAVKIYEAVRACFAGKRWRYEKPWTYRDKWKY